jgi:hypothetical protein
MNRHGAAKNPSILAGVMKEPMLNLADGAGVESILPSREDGFPVIGVDKVDPLLPVGCMWSYPRKFAPTLVVVVVVTVRPRRPDHMRHCVNADLRCPLALMSERFGNFTRLHGHGISAISIFVHDKSARRKFL